jgi:SAM-dependent methyltransferase
MDGIRVRPVTACYLCGRRGGLLATNLHDRLFSAPGTWAFRHCPRCSLAWLDPQPLAGDIDKLYVEYFTHHTQDARDVDHPDAGRRWRTEVKDAIADESFGYPAPSSGPSARTLASLLGKVRALRDVAGAQVMWLGSAARGRVLDVGCGSGEFLAHMRALGWEVYGVEPDAVAASVARNRLGDAVFRGTLREAPLEERSFDAVTLSHVIEHVPEPVRELESCARLLREGGRLVVLTPNIEALGRRTFDTSWMAWDPPRHLYLLSQRALATCAERAGLRVLCLRTTARLARAMWHASRALRRDGTLPEGEPRDISWRLQLEGTVFWGTEALLARRRPRGEELLMMATVAR